MERRGKKVCSAWDMPQPWIYEPLNAFLRSRRCTDSARSIYEDGECAKSATETITAGSKRPVLQVCRKQRPRIFFGFRLRSFLRTKVQRNVDLHLAKRYLLSPDAYHCIANIFMVIDRNLQTFLCFSAIFLSAYINYMQHERLITIPEVEATLEIPVSLTGELSEFHIGVEDLLHGLISLSGELVCCEGIRRKTCRCISHASHMLVDSPDSLWTA